ncbi:MAG: hypothetical protein H6755_02390 [Candidatus Omnitrophica bacterium]|nr:hypothetical protein [Candidatus Omnitrophota bacterium]
MQEVVCPHCKKTIYDEDALLCHFCGESLSRAGNGFISRMRYANPRIIWYIVTFLVLVSFLWLFVK